MSRYNAQNFIGVPPPNHPSHTGGNNSNGHQNKLHQNVAAAAAAAVQQQQQQQQQITLANVPSQQQQQQQKNKLVTSEIVYSSTPVNQHQPTSHQHGAAINHNNFRMTHPPNSSYHVTSTSASYSQSGPPPQQQQQIPTGPASLRTANLTSTASTLQTVSSQQHQTHQEHKMQQQQSQQPHQPSNMIMHNPYSRQAQQQSAYNRNLAGSAPTPRGGINNVGGLASTGSHAGGMNQRQPSHPHQQAATPTPTQQLLFPHQVVMHSYPYAAQRVTGYAHQQNSLQYPYSQFYMPVITQQQRASGSSTQHMASLGGTGNVSGAASSPLQSHQQSSHQAQLNAHTIQLAGSVGHPQMVSQAPPYLMPQTMQQRSTPTETTKRFTHRLQVIDPSSGEDVLNSLDQNHSSSHSSSSNTHSSALKIEAPSPPPSAIAASNTNQSIDSNEMGSLNANAANASIVGVTAHDQQLDLQQGDQPYSSVDHQSDGGIIDETPHTPIVSAIADGPSIDITPKQSKNTKRTNKSPEWPLPSTEKTSDYACDNYSKVATAASTTSSSSNEWIKNQQTGPKVSSENESSEPLSHHMQQPQQRHPHNQKSKQATSNIYIAPPANKMKVHILADARGLNASTNVQQPQQQQQQQEQQTIATSNPPVVTKLQQTSKAITNENDGVPTASLPPPVTSTTAPDTIASAVEPLTHKSDRNKNLLNNINKLDNTSSSCSQKLKQQQAQPQQHLPPQAELKGHSTSDVNVIASPNIDANQMSKSKPIASDISISGSNVTAPAENSKLTTTNTSADETDRAAENILDSNSNIKTNINVNVNKKSSSSNSSSLSSSSTSSTVANTPQPQPQLQQQQQQQTQSQSPQSSSSPKLAEKQITPTSASIETSTSSLKPEIDNNVNTKDSSNNVPISNDSETLISDNGLAETINNIKNNNLTNSTSGININNNNIVDKDMDNNLVNSTEQSSAIDTEQQQSNQPQVNLSRNSSATLTEAAQTNQAALASKPAKSQALLNYEEGQWSPENTDGKKCYNRQQLVTLRDTAASLSEPQIQDQFQLFKKNNFSPNATNNNKNQSSSNNRNQYNKRPSTQGGQGGGGQQMQQGGGKGSKSGMIHVSLSLREDVKLNESANAWKPMFLSGATAAAATVGDISNIDVLCKRVRGILNKLTPEKFDPLLEQLQALNIDTSERLSSVISLVFEKAIDEPNFSSAYAMLCQKLSKPLEEKEELERKTRESAGIEKKNEKTDSAQAVFKKELLNKCQREFDNHVANENSIRLKLLPLQEAINETTDPNRKMELSAQLDEEERKMRRRSVGTVRFIGELYRQNMLLTSIMEWCIMALLTIRNEEKLECLCKLLTTVGKKMEHKTHDEEYDKKYYRDLGPHFATMEKIASDKKQLKISSRVRFMLMDVIELRKNKWVPRRVDANPKKMGQIQKEAEQEQYHKQIQMMAANMSNNPGMGNNNMRKDNRDRNDRGPNMRNDSRGGSMSGGGYMNNNNSNKSNRGNYQDTDGWIQQGSNKGRGGNTNTSFDPTKFRASSNIEDITKTSLGTPNQFQWKLNTQQTTSLTNSFSALESDSYKPGGNRSKEPYNSKGSIERERDGGPGSRSGSQHGSRDNSAARNSYSSSRSLQQMRPSQMQFNTLPMNSSSSQKGIRSDSKLHQQSQHQSLSSSTTSLAANILPSSSLTPSSSDPKLSEDVSDAVMAVIKSTLQNLLKAHQKDEFREYTDLENAPQLEKINESNRWAVVRELHNMAVDIPGLTEAKRCFIGTICTYWIKNNRITKRDYKRGLSEYITLLADIVIDVPKIYEWTAQMISVTIADDAISLNDLKNTAEDSRAKLVGALLIYLTYEYGPQYVRDLWKRSKCQWEQFVVNEDVDKFLERNKLRFVENLRETVPPASTPISHDRFRSRIRDLVRKENFSEKEFNEYFKIHVPTINKQSIRLLTKTLIEAALDKGFTLNEPALNKCLEILKTYIGGEDKLDLQMECLYAIQLLSNELEHPSGLLRNVFHRLYEFDVCTDNAFKKWSESNEEPLGKGVAMKNLTTFLKMIDELEEDEEDDAEEDGKPSYKTK